MNFLKKALIGLAGAASLVAAPAMADTRYWNVAANSFGDLTLTACGPQVRVNIVGDHDTDLDFWVYDYGNLIYSDTDGTDVTSFTLNTGLYSGCRNFLLRIRNYGSVYNTVTVQVY